MIDVKAEREASRRGRRLKIEGPDGQELVLYYRGVDGATSFAAAVERWVEEERTRIRAARLAALSEEEQASLRSDVLGPAGMRVWTAGVTMPPAVLEEAHRAHAASHLVTGWEDGDEFVAASTDPQMADDLVGIDWVWIALREAAFRASEVEHDVAKVGRLVAEIGKKKPASNSAGPSNGAASSKRSASGKRTRTKSRNSAGKPRKRSPSQPAASASAPSTPGA